MFLFLFLFDFERRMMCVPPLTERHQKTKESDVKNLSDVVLLLWLNAWFEGKPLIREVPRGGGEEMIRKLREETREDVISGVSNNRLCKILGLKVVAVKAVPAAEETEGRLEELSTSFKSKFVDSGALKELVDLIVDKAAEKEAQRNASPEQKRLEKYPYIPIFQSSGSGKSKLIYEMAQKSFFTIYWCLRMTESTGFPVQSSAIVKSLNFLVRKRLDSKGALFSPLFLSSLFSHLISLISLSSHLISDLSPLLSHLSSPISHLSSLSSLISHLSVLSVLSVLSRRLSF
jgi:hypothetical protein